MDSWRVTPAAFEVIAMTLNVTVLTQQTTYLSDDFRLTEFETRRLITDRSPKTVTLTYMDWNGFITYTGVGSWRGRNVSELVAEWLTGPANLSIAEVANIVATKGTELLREIERQYPRRRHTFTLAGFDGDRVSVYVISNFEDCRGNNRTTIDDHLTVTTRSLGRGKKATVIVTGQKSAVLPNDRGLLGRVGANYPGDSLRIRRRMADLNADAASRSRRTVSRDCVVLSFSADGSGAMLLDSNAVEIPNQFPHISNGIDLNKSLVELFKNLGVDPSQLRLVQAGFGSSRGQQVAMQRVPCNYAVRDPDPSIGYQLSEISSTGFELMAPRDISDRGQVVGTGRAALGQPHDIPWSYSNSQVSRLNYTGAAAAVSDTGEVAAVLEAPGAYRAALYRGEAPIELPLYHGEPGVFAGSDSYARAINSRGILAGEVRSQAEERGRPNMLAALFQLRQPSLVFTELAADFGTRATAINERGQVLVMVGRGVFDVRSVLWNPADDTWEYVGDDTSNVYPIALNDDGTVLGQARSARAQPVAVICRPAGRWERLGTDDNWAPVDMNNSGEVVGRVMIDLLDRPWLYRSTGETILLPYVTDHHTTLAAINNHGQIVGSAGADHGAHALLWSRAANTS
jgi:hypothetical protein